MAIRTTKQNLEPGRPREATLIGITQVYHKDGPYKDQVKGFFIQTKEFQDMYMNYNNKDPEKNYELGKLVNQLAGPGTEYDDEKMDEFVAGYTGTVVKVRRYEKVVTEVLSEEQATALQEQLNAVPDDRVEITFNQDGTATKTTTHINVGF